MHGRPRRRVERGGQIGRLNGQVCAVRLFLHRECTRDLLLRSGEAEIRFAQFVGQLVGVLKIDIEYLVQTAFLNDVRLARKRDQIRSLKISLAKKSQPKYLN